MGALKVKSDGTSLSTTVSQTFDVGYVSYYALQEIAPAKQAPQPASEPSPQMDAARRIMKKRKELLRKLAE